MQPHTVADALSLAARNLPGDEARAEAELLLAHCLGKPRSWLYAHANDSFPETAGNGFRDLIARRARGEPVAHILGSQEFWSLPLVVTSDTLIPRPETELLVELALQRLAPDAPLRVLDLGTGTGAIALAIAHERSLASVTAVERNPRTLDIARRNAARLAPGRIRFLAGDWFSPVQDESFDLIVSNPPYLATGDSHLSQGDLRFEPEGALVAGEDGLECIRRIVAEARRFLAPSAWLFIEHGLTQGAQVRGLMTASGLSDVTTFIDLEQRDRVTGGFQPD
jgi:release factor glutamine methyltransferase